MVEDRDLDEITSDKELQNVPMVIRLRKVYVRMLTAAIHLSIFAANKRRHHSDT